MTPEDKKLMDYAIDKFGHLSIADMLVVFGGIPEHMIDRDAINEEGRRWTESYDPTKIPKPGTREEVEEFNRKYFFDASGQMWDRP